jgi:uncharacterized protein (DUF1015 family)
VAPRPDGAASGAAPGREDTAALFLLRPVDVDTVFELAAAGEPLPAKSTSFRPKPRTGLIMRDIAGAPR